MSDILRAAIAEVENDYKSIPGGEELTKKISKRFEKYYNSPNVHDINFKIGSDFSLDEVRTLLFNPSTQDAALYPRLITPPNGESLTSSDTSLFVLTLLYIVHRKRWPLMVEFILHGGLAVLAQLMMDTNHYVRGQVVEVFLAATDCDTFDWCVPATRETEQLHTNMLLLFFDSHFINNLIANRTSYPGGSIRCLQLLAFYLSYLRVQHTASHVLGLSSELLTVIQEWCSDRDDADEQEKKLADTLVEDFGSAVIDADVHVGTVGCDGHILYGLSARPANVPLQVINPLPPKAKLTTDDLKEQGNECYRSGKYGAALTLYRKAIAQIDENSALAASLHYNCGSCYWKLWQSEEQSINDTPIKDSPQAEAQHIVDEVTSVCNKVHALEACVQHCSSACNLTPTHHRAQYRLCSALIELHRETEALKQIANAKQILTTQYNTLDKENESTRNEIAVALKLLEDLRVRCNARLLLNQKSSVESSTAAILDQLRARRDREMNSVSHPWSGWQPPEDEQEINEVTPDSSATEVTFNISDTLAIPTLSNASTRAKKKDSKEIKDASGIATNKKSSLKYLKSLRTARTDAAVLQVLRDSWGAKIHLKHIFGASMDEELLMKVLQVVVNSEGDSDAKKQILLDLNKCAHVETALTLALVGNDDLKHALLNRVHELVSDVDKVSTVLAILRK